jgi:hypothetical protein
MIAERLSKLLQYGNHARGISTLRGGVGPRMYCMYDGVWTCRPRDEIYLVTYCCNPDLTQLLQPETLQMGRRRGQI